jgi:hypothetical protein
LDLVLNLFILKAEVLLAAAVADLTIEKAAHLLEAEAVLVQVLVDQAQELQEVLVQLTLEAVVAVHLVVLAVAVQVVRE